VCASLPFHRTYGFRRNSRTQLPRHLQPRALSDGL
jgi:hypothetical protein